MNKPAIAFFGFNRPDCTKIVFEEIRRYRPQKLFLVADGPRLDVPTDRARCERVREIMKAVDWECDVKTNFSDKNLGCKERMSSGVDWVFSQVDEAIFLEDDCVPCPDFFKFCSQMLVHYRDQPKIMSIAGTNYQCGRVRGDGSYYFSKYSHIWGWASWKRAWQHYDVTMTSWPQARQEKWVEKFMPQEEQSYWNNFINEVYEGRVNTWDLQWVYACWRNNGVGIIPNVNLIRNIGAGPDATHTKGEIGSLEIATGTLDEIVHPKNMLINDVADKFTFQHHFCPPQPTINKNSPRVVRRILSKVKRKVVTLLG